VQKKVIAAVVVALLVVGGYFAWIHIRWYLYTMKVRDSVEAVGRFPHVPDLIHLRDTLEANARENHVPVDNWSCDLTLERRSPLGAPVSLYYIVATVHDGPRSFTYSEHQVESQTELLEGAADLEAGHVHVKK
jgi:hypothetical protein